MTTTDTGRLLELAARCERATGPDKLLDAQIGRAVGANGKAKNVYKRGHYIGGKPVLHRVDWVFSPYTASLDAAMSLYLRVPERVPSNPRIAAAEALRQRAEDA